jgi:type IV/VI secretion system ImpK/VasF family protein
MTLLELCEPLFQYVCRLNRSVRKGVRPDPAQGRAEIKALFTDMKNRASTNPVLMNQYEKVRLPLVFFVDFMVRDSAAFGRSWTDLANEEHPPQLGGDEKLFDLLDETLKEPGDAAGERLAIFYTCLGLGFTGWYQGQPEYLRKKMLEVSSRMRGTMELDEAAKICPEAYEKVNTADLVQPPGSKLVGIAIAVAGLVLVVLAANIAAYLDHRATLDRSLDALLRPGEPGAERRAAVEGAP